LYNFISEGLPVESATGDLNIYFYLWFSTNVSYMNVIHCLEVFNLFVYEFHSHKLSTSLFPMK
jgi:hypothetical protein